MKITFNHAYWRDRFKELGEWINLVGYNPSLLKYFLPWLSLKREGYKTLENKIPWITFEAIDWLESFLNMDMRIFEWGSGGSTLYYQTRVKEITSVEHDPKWYERVKRLIRPHCKYVLTKPKKKNNPFPYTSSDPSYKKYSFENYCKVIKSYRGKFDLVSVDGRSRVECVREGMKKVKKGGYLLLDNSERTEYSEVFVLLQKWKKTHFFGPGPYNGYFWRTSVFQKS